MPKLSIAITALCFLSLTGICRGQDIVKVAPEHSKVLFENDEVRIVETTLAPGDKDPVHTHPSGWYYVTSPGTMKIVFPDGKTATWESQVGEGSWLTTKSPHADENVGNTTIVWVLVEVKSSTKVHAATQPPSKPKA